MIIKYDFIFYIYNCPYLFYPVMLNKKIKIIIKISNFNYFLFIDNLSELLAKVYFIIKNY